MSGLGGSGQRLLVIGLGTTVLVFLVAPLVIVVGASLDPGPFFEFPPRQLSFHWFGELLDREEWRESLNFTLMIAALTALVATAIGAGAGIALGRMGANARRVVLALTIGPLIVPAVVLGLAFYQVALGYALSGTTLAFVAANAVLTAPVIALFVAAAVRGIDPRLEFASLSAGAGRWRTLTRITVPLIAPAALAGAAFSFLLTLDEVVVSSFLVAPGRVPVAVRMFQEVQHGSTPLVTALASLIIVTVVAMAAAITAARRWQDALRYTQPSVADPNTSPAR